MYTVVSGWCPGPQTMCAHSSLPWSRSPKPAHSDVGISFFFFVGDVSPCGTSSTFTRGPMCPRVIQLSFSVVSALGPFPTCSRDSPGCAPRVRRSLAARADPWQLVRQRPFADIRSHGSARCVPLSSQPSQLGRRRMAVALCSGSFQVRHAQGGHDIWGGDRKSVV